MLVHKDLATLELIFLDLLIKTLLFSLPLSLHPPPLSSYWACSKQAAGVLGRSLHFYWGCELDEWRGEKSGEGRGLCLCFWKYIYMTLVKKQIIASI